MFWGYGSRLKLGFCTGMYMRPTDKQAKNRKIMSDRMKNNTIIFIYKNVAELLPLPPPPYLLPPQCTGMYMRPTDKQEA